MSDAQYALGRKVISAALRAGVAWTRRLEEPRAWHEISCMHGVIQGHLPLGAGPETPAGLVGSLTRPLRSWVPLDWSGLPAEMGDLVILEDGHDQRPAQLTEEAYEVGCSYLEVLFDPATGGLDGGRDWLPTWSWQTAEQTEHAVYRQLVSGSQAQYVAGRLMLVEVPTGTEDSILEEYTRRGGARMQVYRPLPAERSCVRAGAVWWWPCPVCAYPMRLTGELLRCDFLPHQRKARVLLRPGRRPGDPPETVNGPAGLAACRGEGVLCLDWPVWRHLTVPGLTEVELMRWLERKGLEVERWGEMDSWDVGVTLPNGRCLVDVKDVANEQNIIDRPPRAKTIVVPSHRSEQVKPLRAALEPSGYTVHTVASFKRMISTQLQLGAA
ncbi:restriction endonuclease-related protein [Streptomyces sp. OK228]|uniref:restriction endonuclease-related protein n=1 Tax=Streptomyces sp. OK228 TaxID=1882786 RepID=UPI000BD313BA|nr:hypothetical protein [Streptomyces sp. OK228]SOE24896.1 hypothetical protein SAMN05442782_1559 [Streptomyces sp. OK228]